MDGPVEWGETMENFGFGLLCLGLGLAVLGLGFLIFACCAAVAFDIWQDLVG